jgi:hypothetical protein
MCFGIVAGGEFELVPLSSNAFELSDSCANDTVQPMMKCLLFNAQSLCNKLCDLDYLLQNARPDIVFITETWLTPDITNGLLDKHKVYNIYRAD